MSGFKISKKTIIFILVGILFLIGLGLAQLVDAATIFYEGFESGDFTCGNCTGVNNNDASSWTTWQDQSGDGGPNVATGCLDKPYCAGTYSVQMCGGDGGTGGHACDGSNYCTGISHTIDTTGYNNINLTFTLSDIGDNFEDNYRADFSVDGGSTWTNIVTVTTPSTTYNEGLGPYDLSSLDSNVEDNANVVIRFWQEETYACTEDSWTDEVGVTGDIANQSPTITSVSESTDPINEGATQTVTPSGVGDAEGDALHIYCCQDTDNSCISTTADTCDNDQTWSSPYSGMTCTLTTPSLDNDTTYYARCRLHDGSSYSSPIVTTNYTVSALPAGTFTVKMKDGCDCSAACTEGEACEWCYGSNGTDGYCCDGFCKTGMCTQVPVITSVSDSPDPQGGDSAITFTSISSDPDGGDTIKLYICKDGSCTNCGPNSGSGCWASSTSGVTENASTSLICLEGDPCNYSTNEYWAKVCDNNNACSDILGAGEVTDSFTDETKIASHQNLVVSGGQVKLTDVCYGVADNTQVAGCDGLCQACQGGVCSYADASTDPGDDCVATGCSTDYCSGTSATCDGLPDNTQGPGCDGLCQACQGGACSYADASTDPGDDCTQGSTDSDGCGIENCSGTSASCAYQTSGDGGCPVCGTCVGATSIACEFYAEGSKDETSPGTCTALHYRCDGAGVCDDPITSTTFCVNYPGTCNTECSSAGHDGCTNGACYPYTYCGTAGNLLGCSYTCSTAVKCFCWSWVYD